MAGHCRARSCACGYGQRASALAIAHRKRRRFADMTNLYLYVSVHMCCLSIHLFTPLHIGTPRRLPSVSVGTAPSGFPVANSPHKGAPWREGALARSDARRSYATRPPSPRTCARNEERCERAARVSACVVAPTTLPHLEAANAERCRRRAGATVCRGRRRVCGGLVAGRGAAAIGVREHSARPFVCVRLCSFSFSVGL